MKNLVKLYFILVSLGGIIGVAVGYGFLANSYFMNQYINDDEYIISRSSYEITQCSQPDYAAVKTGEQPVARTQAQIDECTVKTRKSIVDQRHVDTKVTMLQGTLWGTIALILFITHFPAMIRRSKEEVVK